MRIEYDKTHISFLKNVINDYISKIQDFVKDTYCHFTELDVQVHELRRKVRWLSMYAQALNGIIQLKKQHKPYAWEKEYISRSVIANPYNKIVKPPKGIQQIHYNEAIFYALSKLISDLGVLKDQGLKLDLLSKAIRKTNSINETVATQKALELLGKKQPTIEKVLEDASALAKHFFVEQKILGELMVK
jgi:hypothetical protein